MARLECRCGESMSTSVCPSPNIINIFTKEEIKEALIRTPNILLWDYYTDTYNGVEYWYCPKCKRIYFVEAVPLGSVLKVYAPFNSNSSPIFSFSKSNYNELFILFDTEIDAITELSFGITISDYFKAPQKTRYFRDNTNDVIYVYKNGNLEFCYKEEK